MHYVLIQGSSYRGLDFEDRERVRDELRGRLESHGVRFLQYDWVWDEEDRCLLVAGQYEKAKDARYWIEALDCMGFTVRMQTHLPGEETERRSRRGIRIALRPLRSEDKDLLRSFAESLSEEDLRFRFFRRVETTDDLLKRLVQINPAEQRAILALVESETGDQIAGVGRLFMDRERQGAELVITVGRPYRNKGIGRELLLYLIGLAREQKLKGLTARVLADNTAMLRLLRSLDGVEYTIRRTMDAGVFHMEMVFR